MKRRSPVWVKQHINMDQQFWHWMRWTEEPEDSLFSDCAPGEIMQPYLAMFKPELQVYANRSTPIAQANNDKYLSISKCICSAGGLNQVKC